MLPSCASRTSLRRAVGLWNSNLTRPLAVQQVEDNSLHRNAPPGGRDASFTMNQRKTNERANAFVSRTGWYSFYYPKGWAVEESDDSTAVYEPEQGVGALHISAYQTPSPVNPRSELIEHLSDNVPPVDEERIVSFSSDSKNVASFDCVNNQNFHKIWFIGDGSFLVLVNYVSDKEDVGSELTKVDEIVASIRVQPKLSRN